MDLREEIPQSKDRLLSESSENKLATPGGKPRFNPFDKKAKKLTKQNVLNPMPLSMYDPSEQSQTKKIVSAKAPTIVYEKKKEKVVKDKEKEKEIVVKDKDKEKEKKKKKVVKDKEKEKEIVVKDKDKEKEKEKEKVVKDKETLQVDEVILNVVSDLASEKPKEKSKEKVKSKASKGFPVLFQVKPNDQHASKSSKSSKSVKKNASKLLSKAPILRNKPVEKDDTPKRKRVVSKADKSKKDTVDIQDSQLDVKKKKAKVQEQEDSDDFQDEKKQKLKTKVVVKRKRDDLGSDSSDSEQVVPKRKNLLKKKVAKDESDEDVKPKKRGQKKENELTPEEAKHKEYVLSFQILHARTVPTSLYTAIHQSKQVNMGKFLSEIGFSSFNNLDIDYIPSKLGRYVVSKSDAQTYMLTLENGKSIEVTHAKIHEILGIPTGGISLFSLDYRPDCEFERHWVGQFGSMSLKKIRVKDIALKLIESKEVDFLFKVNFLTLFINTMGMCAGLKGQINMEVVRRLREDTDISGIDWCDYIHNCLQYSKLPSTLLNQYTGPYLFLVLLYMDSTKFERLPIVRTRPAIKNWSSILMGQRQELELKEEVVGMLDLHEDWTEFEVNESEGFVEGGSSESSFKEKTLFARHLNINGHSKHAAIRKAKPRIPKLKWRTKKNFQDCGVFTMLHMETYTGQAATKWDCGMVAESKEQYDMLRRLRFKYATKILLHEINVHAGKMLELATEFDKIPPSERYSIISEAARNRDARECMRVDESLVE